MVAIPARLGLMRCIVEIRHKDEDVAGMGAEAEVVTRVDGVEQALGGLPLAVVG